MKIKPILLLSLSAAIFASLGFAACGTTEEEIMNQENAISVRYDCGDGNFANAKDLTLHDVIPLEKVAEEDGKKTLKLVEPGDPKRGEGASVSFPSYTGYFLAGWYKTKTLRVNENGEPLDECGELVSVSGKAQGYSYSEKWDFDNDVLTLDASKEYNASEAVLTLYAAWVPQFSFSFMVPETYEADGVTVKTWKEASTKTFDPTVQEGTLILPVDDTKTGGLKLNDIPEQRGKTFVGAYADEACTNEWTATSEHAGDVDEATGTAIAPVQKIYTTWKNGEWFKITTASQLQTSAAATRYFELQADIDFEGIAWPVAFSSTRFNGAIYGNGHKISNITAKQTNISATFFGLFGSLGEKAVLDSVTFENATLDLDTGSRVPQSRFGLLAGDFSATTVFNDVSVSGKVKISDEIYDNKKDEVSYANYSLGLLFGETAYDSDGNPVAHGIDTSAIACEVYVKTQDADNTKTPAIEAHVEDGIILLDKVQQTA